MARLNVSEQVPLEIDVMELGRLIKKSNLYKSIRKKLPKMDFSVGYIEPFSSYGSNAKNGYGSHMFSWSSTYTGIRLNLNRKSAHLFKENKDELVKTLAGLFLFLAHTSSGHLSFNVVKNTAEKFTCIIHRTLDKNGNRINTSYIDSGLYTVVDIEEGH